MASEDKIIFGGQVFGEKELNGFGAFFSALKGASINAVCGLKNSFFRNQYYIFISCLWAVEKKSFK